MNETTREFVRRRADYRCEYCHLPEAGHDERFSVDHITSRKHGGTDDPDNLALCCLRCNVYKGSDLTGLDPRDHSLHPLFRPRRQIWAEHFRWEGTTIHGISPVGRITVNVLRMNASERVQLRDMLRAEGRI